MKEQVGLKPWSPPRRRHQPLQPPLQCHQGKLEGDNPAGSVKDRAALSMIRPSEAPGVLELVRGGWRYCFGKRLVRQEMLTLEVVRALPKLKLQPLIVLPPCCAY